MSAGDDAADRKRIAEALARGEMITLAEAAAHFRCSERWLRDFVKRHPYYRKAGRAYVFSRGDVARLGEAMRPIPRPRSTVRDDALPTESEIARRLDAALRPRKRPRRR